MPIATFTQHFRLPLERPRQQQQERHREMHEHQQQPDEPPAGRADGAVYQVISSGRLPE